MASKTTTYVVRTESNPEGFDARASDSVAYTHACVRPADGVALSWHKSESNAAKAAAALVKAGRGPVEVLPAEAHEGTKATVVKRLLAGIDLRTPEVAEVEGAGTNRAAEILSGALGIEVVEVEAAPVAEAPKARPNTKPTTAVHPERQAHLDEIGLAMYRSRYDRGWEAFRTGEGVARVVEGRAQLPWLDGFEDAACGLPKWSAMRSPEPFTVQTPRPGLAKAGLSPAPEATLEAPEAPAAPVQPTPAPRARKGASNKS